MRWGAWLALLAMLCMAPHSADAEVKPAELGEKNAPLVAREALGGQRGGASFEVVRAGLDAEKVAALVATRLKEVRNQALRELLDSLGDDFAIAPVRDLVETVAVLITPGYDALGRSQTVEALLLRLGASAALATVLLPPQPEVNGEKIAMDVHRLHAWDAAYEGLARSIAAQSLGFGAATGKVVAGYEELANTVTTVADGLMLARSLWSVASKEPLGRRAEAVAGACGEAMKARVTAAQAATETGGERAATALAQAKAAETAVGKLGPDSTVAELADGLEAVYAAQSDAWRQQRVVDGCSVAYATLMDVLGAERVPLAEKLAALDALVTRMASGPEAEKWLAWIWLVHDVLRTGMTRATVQRLSALVVAEVERMEMNDALKAALVGVFEELPLAVREEVGKDGAVTITVDVTTLADGMVRRYAWEDRPGLYLRATVGTGYWSVVSGEATTGMVPAVYEELGVGWRWALCGGRLLLGPHLAASGLLHRLVLEDEVEDGVLVLGGASLNVYSAIDVSVGGGYLVHARDDEQEDAWVVLAGLQVPLVDYLSDADDR